MPARMLSGVDIVLLHCLKSHQPPRSKPTDRHMQDVVAWLSQSRSPPGRSSPAPPSVDASLVWADPPAGLRPTAPFSGSADDQMALELS
jgi:hypothetical protein